MNNNSIEPWSLGQELTAKASELVSQHREREEKMVDITLKHIADNVVSKEADIMALITSSKGQYQTALRQIVEKEVIRAADEMLWCDNYSERAKSEQRVNVFIGSHWEPIGSSLWKDFVDLCAECCRVPELQRMNQSFMNPLYEGVAFNLKKYRRQIIPNDETWMNFQNGTLVLRKDGSRELRAHCKEDYFFYTLPYVYNEQAECPQWHKFLDRVLPDPQSQLLLAEYIGYCLMKTHELEKMLWFYGPGQNGKSVTLETIEGLLGSKNISYLTLESLTNDQRMRCGIENKLLNISFETGRNINANVMKQLTSGEPVTIEHKYVDAREITNYGKFITATNQLPRAENTGAFYRRIIILPFEVTIPDEEKDVQLADKLKLELSGILNWMLEALTGLMERKAFTICASSEKAMEEYKLESDNVRLFVSEMLEASITTTNGTELYKAYQDYCKDSGLNALGRTHFYKRLDEVTHSRESNGNLTIFKLKLSEQ